MHLTIPNLVRKSSFLSLLLSTGLLTGTSSALALQYQASLYGGGTSTTYHNIGSVNFVGETDQLVPTNTTDTTVTWGVAAALRTDHIPALWQKLVREVSIGPEFFYFNAKSSGEVWQFGLPEMNNLTYSMPVQSVRLLGTNEITFQPITPKTYPFFEWGLGFAANQASYQEHPRPTYLASGISLGARTQYSFSYTVGGGLKMDITPFTKLQNELQLTLRYLYANLGSAAVSNQSNSLVTSPISVNLYTQTWVAGLTYLF